MTDWWLDLGILSLGGYTDVRLEMGRQMDYKNNQYRE